MVARKPRLVLEVLSDRNRRVDEYVKLNEYKGVASLDYIILMSPREVDVAVWSRDADRQWQHSRHHAVTDTIELPLPGITLSLMVLYEGIEIRPESPIPVR